MSPSRGLPDRSGYSLTGAGCSFIAAGPVWRRPVALRFDTAMKSLALLYNEQGLRPEEIAQKLRLSTYTVSQIILGSRNRGKL